MAKTERIRIKLEHVRLSFPHFSEPQAPKDTNADPRYNGNFLFEYKGANHKKVRDAIKQALEDPTYIDVWKNKQDDPRFDKGVKNGDEKTFKNDEGEWVVSEGYEGMRYINAKATKRFPPVYVDRRVRTVALPDADDVFYGGCYVNVVVELFPFNKAGNFGISWGLIAIQFNEDGEPFAGGGEPVDAHELFTDLGDGDAAAKDDNPDDNDW